MLTFLALLLGSSLPIYGFYLLLRRAKRQLDAAGAYRQVASDLGLSVDFRGVSLQGHLGHRRLWIGEVMVGYGADRQMAIWGVMDHERPLGLGLQVRRRGLSERVFRRGRAPGVEVGDGELDRRFEVHGDSAARVRALLGDRAVRHALLALQDSHPDVVVTDRSVRVLLSRHETVSARLAALVDQLLTLSEALSRARQAVPVPERLQSAVREFARLAEDHGLETCPWLPALHGDLAGRSLRIDVDRGDRGYAAELTLTFREHRPTGLRLTLQNGLDGYWNVGQDIQLGDDDFDRMFVVKGYDPTFIREHLGPQQQAALLAACSLGHLQVDDQALHLQGLAVDAAVLERALASVVAVADALGW